MRTFESGTLPSEIPETSGLTQSLEYHLEPKSISRNQQISGKAEKILSPQVSHSKKGITYTEPLLTGWKPPLPIRRMSRNECESIRKRWHIIVHGDDIPPPIKNFKDMRFPEPILKLLKTKGIVQPTPIQVQGLPVILSGREMIGIAFTGSGKTLVFVLPLIMVAQQEEVTMLIVPGEGPFGLVICPSREFARQTYEVVEQFLIPMRECRYPELRPLLCIGGVDMRSQLEVTLRSDVENLVLTESVPCTRCVPHSTGIMAGSAGPTKEDYGVKLISIFTHSHDY